LTITATITGSKAQKTLKQFTLVVVERLKMVRT